MAANLLRGVVPAPGQGERLETLARRGDCRIERIVSLGHATPPGEWYDQARDEWVVLLAGAARLRLADPDETVALAPGDWLLIAAHRRHRVEWTVPDTPSVWLAVHL